MKKIIVVSICLVAALSFNSQCRAAATEVIGNKLLNELNYEDWPGLMPVINDMNRVYQVWVNGCENLYYKGGTRELNECLKKFADTPYPVREVVIRPGPAEVKTFKGARMPYDWELIIIGGISKFLTTLERGAKVWNKYPTFVIYVGEGIKLNEIRLPAGVQVLELSDLKKRHHEGLLSSDKTVRGWGAGRLARLDPYDDDSLEAIVKLLKDEDQWVRLNAAGALGVFGRKAQSAIPALKECSKTADERLQKRIEQLVQQIEGAEDKTDLEKRHSKLLAKIGEFVKELKQQEQ